MARAGSRYKPKFEIATGARAFRIRRRTFPDLTAGKRSSRL